MRSLLWFVIMLGGCISLIIGMWGCSPAPTDVNTDLFYPGSCNSKGICCYQAYGGSSSTFSCVATRIEITVLPGEIKSEYQREETTGGEVQAGALEARILKGID